MALREGDVLASYRIVSLLGRGGVGAVYLAQDLRLDRRVALKILSHEVAEVAAIRERFVSESRLAASLDHPHIVPIYEAGEADGQLYIAMRYVPGPDLAGVIERDGPMSAERTARIVSQVASALDMAHAAGLIHRDVKPGNILLGPGAHPGTDHAYLADFGLTKHVGYGAGATRTGQLLGTVGYIAPEQIEGRPLDHRVDIYSLACVAYECLAGRAPFARDTDMAVLMAHLQSPPPSLAEIRSELPDAVDAAVSHGLAKDPEDRPATAGELATELATAVRPESRVATLTRGFLFADLRGYTAFVEANGDRAAARLLDAYRTLVRDVARRFGGAEIRTEGDSFYLVFPTVSGAVAGGLRIVGAASAASERDPDLPLHVGIGIHAGESAVGSEGPVGLAVNIAARLCSLAAPGEVLVSGTVRSLVRSSGDFTFTPRGRRTLKGVAEPVETYAVHATASRGVGGRPPTIAAGRERLGRRPVAAIATGVAGLALLAAVLLVTRPGGTGPGPLASSGASGSSGTSVVPSSGSLSPAASAAAIATGPTSELVYSVEDHQTNPDLGAPCSAANSDTEARLYALPDGAAEPIRLIDPPLDVWERQPAWSPDATRIAFAADGADWLQSAPIMTVAPDGSGLQGVSVPGVTDRSIYQVAAPRWSPDGRRFAFLDAQPDGTGTAYTVGADGAGQVLIGPAISVTWAPDGRLTWVEPADDQNSVWSGAADGSGKKPLAIPAQLDSTSVAWSPDGGHVLVTAPAGFATTGSQIFVLNADGSGLSQLTTVGDNVDPAWSPDGQQVAFASDRDGHFEIYRMDADGSDQVRMTHSAPDQDACHPAWAMTDGPVAAAPPFPSPGASVAPLAFHRGRLEAGTYRDATFQPAVEFTLPTGWEGSHDFVDGSKIQPVGGTASFRLSDGIAVMRVRAGLPSGCIDAPVTSTVIGGDPSDVIDFIEHDRFLAVDPAVPIVIGGHSGLRTHLSVKRLPGCLIGGSSVWLFLVGQDQFRVQDGDEIDVYALDVDGETVTILVGGPDGKPTDPFMTQASAILDSIRFP